MITKEKYFETYKESIFKILDKYVEKERLRLSQIIKEEDYQTIAFNKYDIENLQLAIMLQSSKKLIENKTTNS